MSNKIEEIRIMILNKKMPRVPSAGYDPLEVDKFLDQISKFLREFSQEVNALYENKEYSKSKIIELKSQLEKSNEKNYILDVRNKDLLKDGYQSHNMMQEIKKLKKKMDEK